MNEGSMQRLYRFLVSIRLTVVLTYVIVFVTMVGSFAMLYDAEIYRSIDDTVLIDWIMSSGLFASWWIVILVVLIFLFSINTIFCTYHRIAALIRAGRDRSVLRNEGEETLVTRDIERGGGIRVRTLLPYIVHIGFLIALAGHLVGSLWGTRGADFVVVEGETVPVAGLKGWAVKVDELYVAMSERGYPKEMNGRVSILYDGEVLKEKIVEVNRPLIIGDIAVYIKNVYNIAKGMSVRISWQGREESFVLEPDSNVTVNDGRHRIVAGRMDTRYGIMEVLVFDGKRMVKRGWISPYDPRFRFIDFGGGRISAERLSLVRAGMFNVNRDPGAMIVFVGLALFVVSLVAHLFSRKPR